MKNEAVAGAFNGRPAKSLDDVRRLTEKSPEDARALVKNLGRLYQQGREAYQWPEHFTTDALAITNDGVVVPAEIGTRPALNIYQVRDASLGWNTKPVYLPGKLFERNGTMFLRMDGGKELGLIASERINGNGAGDLRKDFIGAFVSQEGSPWRVRLKGTFSADGRFKVEFAAPDFPMYRKFEHGRLYWNPQANWLELQTPRGNVVIRNPELVNQLRPLVQNSNQPSLGLILPGEARPGEQGGLVYDDNPVEYGALAGYSRFPSNHRDGTVDTRFTTANFGVGTLTGITIEYPPKLTGRIDRNNVRRFEGLFGENTTNGRFFVFGRFGWTNGELRFKARDVSEQADRWALQGSGWVQDATNTEALQALAEAHDYGDRMGPDLSTRNDGW